MSDIIAKERLGKMNKEIEVALKSTKSKFEATDKISVFNQNKVLEAFSKNHIALRHFSGTTGYGNGDAGRDALNSVVADIFGAEKAIASPLIASGTHALTLSLFGVLRPSDVVLSVSGEPYDTLQDVIHGSDSDTGSLRDFDIQFFSLPLVDNDFDYVSIRKFLESRQVRMVYIQRSRGYAWRLALKIEQIEKLCKFVKDISPDSVIFCDNCYGEFVETKEPTEVGVDYCAGSFIKNIGGGLAPGGGYIAGKEKYVNLVGGRFTVPGIGSEIGSYPSGYRLFFQGLFSAPHVVNQAIKTALLFSQALTNRGYEVSPRPDEHFGDIVCSVKLGAEEKMVNFCKAIQSVSPIDGFVSPEPWNQPGYADKVIMAAGCFVQGASIELSCDGPIREPYVVYLQGGLTIEHGILALEKVLAKL